MIFYCYRTDVPMVEVEADSAELAAVRAAMVTRQAGRWVVASTQGREPAYEIDERRSYHLTEPPF